MEVEAAAQYQRLQAFLQRDNRETCPPAASAHRIGLHQEPSLSGRDVLEPRHPSGNDDDEEAAQWLRLQEFLSDASSERKPLRSSDAAQFRCLHGPVVQPAEYQRYFESVCPQASDGIHYLNARTAAEAEACAKKRQNSLDRATEIQTRPAVVEPVAAATSVAELRGRKRRPAFVPPRAIKRPLKTAPVKPVPTAPTPRETVSVCIPSLILQPFDKAAYS